MGWWFTVVGSILILSGTALSLAGFIISPQETIVTSIRNFFSQTQSIKVLPPSLGGNDTLNLDNVATLKLYVPYSLNSITLLLDVVPTELPDQHNQSFISEGIQTYNQSSGTKYIFDTEHSKRSEITVSGRTFIVTLLKIKKLDIPDVPGAMEYQFGISEK